MNNAFLLIAVALLSLWTLQDNSCRGKSTNTKESKPTASSSPVNTVSPEPIKPPPPTTPATSGGEKLSGLWGGLHVTLESSDQGSTLEFDCASGSISEPILLDSGGRFDVPGSYTRQGPGPTREGVAHDTRAHYSGRVTGETMELEVRLEGASKPIFDLALTRGKQGKVTKCY